MISKVESILDKPANKITKDDLYKLRDFKELYTGKETYRTVDIVNILKQIDSKKIKDLIILNNT